MSNNTTFSVTKVEIGDLTYRSGDVVKFDNIPAFGDALILGFTKPDEFDDVYVRVARPMASATCIGTTSPGVALSVETFEMTLSKLVLCGPAVNDGWPCVSRSMSPEDVEAYSS